MKKQIEIVRGTNGAVVAGQVTKAFMKNANIFGSTEYELWEQFIAKYPDAKMVTKSIKKNPNKKTYKNLKYENMEKYIKTVYGEESKYLAQFEKVKAASAIQKNPYKYVLDWFTATFEGYETHDAFKEEKTNEQENVLPFNNAVNE